MPSPDACGNKRTPLIAFMLLPRSSLLAFHALLLCFCCPCPAPSSPSAVSSPFTVLYCFGLLVYNCACLGKPTIVVRATPATAGQGNTQGTTQKAAAVLMPGAR